jgi:hypothetical protein
VQLLAQVLEAVVVLEEQQDLVELVDLAVPMAVMEE